MSGFTYPGKERPAPRLRRLAGGALLAGMLVAALLAVKSSLDERTLEALLFLTPLSKDKLGDLVANRWAGLLVFFGVSWLIARWAVVAILEFHFFPWFDVDTLSPVHERTGVLRWVDIKDSPMHEAAQRLRVWLAEGVHDGSWLIGWVFRGRPALNEKAFSYALLLGPNGVGKSQMVREVARERSSVDLRGRAASRRSARTREAIDRWVRRVLPRVARLPDDPWQIGEVSPLGDWSERLKAWRPSAPTVLILDDASGGALARDIVDLLDKNSGQFWYSVKLVIVDQFTPPKLNLEQIGRSWRDHLGRTIPVFAVPDVCWSGAQTRRALSGGVWVRDARDGRNRFDPAHDVREFWQESNLERLSRVLDGNPLMLAEAAVWLVARDGRGRPFRTVATLLGAHDPAAFEQDILGQVRSSDYRSDVAHRVIGERVDEVFSDHLSWARDVGLGGAAVIEALCCASLAGGAPLSGFPILLNVQVSRLEMWIARTDRLPPIGSWPIVEAFVERALEDYRGLSLRAILLEALRLNPVGLAAHLTRRGRLARRLFEEVSSLERDAAASLPFALNLFEVASSRAIWADRAAAPQALEAIRRLPAGDLARAQADLEALGAFNGRVPDVLVAVVLLTALGARRFAEATPWDWQAWRAFHSVWCRWLRRFGVSLDFVPQPLRDALITDGRAIYEGLLSAVDHLPADDARYDVLSDALEQASGLTILRDLPAHSGCPVSSWAATFRGLLALEGLARDPSRVAVDLRERRRRCEKIAAAVLEALPPSAHPWQRAEVMALVQSRHAFLLASGGDQAGVKAAHDAIAVLCSQSPSNPRLVEARLLCFYTMLSPLVTRKDAVATGVMEAEEQACGPFVNEHCIVALLMNWSLVLRSGVGSDEWAEQLLGRLQSYAVAFSESDEVLRAYMTAVKGRLLALIDRSHDDSKLVALIAHLERLAEAHSPDFAPVREVPAQAWFELFRTWMFDERRGLAIRAVAERVDRTASAFPDHLGLQGARLFLFMQLGKFESRFGVSSGEPERLARLIEMLAEPFRGVEDVSEIVAHAWESAVYGWRRDTRAWALCERALRRLDKWLADNPSGSRGTHPQVFAWGTVLTLHRIRQDWDAAARLAPEALHCAVAARAADQDNVLIAQSAGQVFTEVALLRKERPSTGDVGDLVQRLDRLAAQFPQSKSLQDCRAVFVNSGAT